MTFDRRDTSLFVAPVLAGKWVRVCISVGILCIFTETSFAQRSGESIGTPEGPVPVEAAIREDEVNEPIGNLRRPQAASEIDRTVDEINALRQRMGGGVADQLNGLFEDRNEGREHLQREFNQELNRLVERSGEASAVPAPSQTPAVQSGQLSGSADHVCRALRSAARQLDQVSADLEDIEMYSEADQIRANAKNLRLRARMMAPRRTARAFKAPQSVLWDDHNPSAKRFGLPKGATDSKIPYRQ